jgi:hypothetical protein
MAGQTRLDDVVTFMVSSYQPMHVLAQGMRVDAKEVADALAVVNKDSPEYVALMELAKLNPYTPKQKKVQNDSTDSVEQ